MSEKDKLFRETPWNLALSVLTENLICSVRVAISDKAEIMNKNFPQRPFKWVLDHYNRTNNDWVMDIYYMTFTNGMPCMTWVNDHIFGDSFVILYKPTSNITKGCGQMSYCLPFSGPSRFRQIIILWHFSYVSLLKI